MHMHMNMHVHMYMYMWQVCRRSRAQHPPPLLPAQLLPPQERGHQLAHAGAAHVCGVAWSGRLRLRAHLPRFQRQDGGALPLPSVTRTHHTHTRRHSHSTSPSSRSHLPSDVLRIMHGQVVSTTVVTCLSSTLLLGGLTAPMVKLLGINAPPAAPGPLAGAASAGSAVSASATDDAASSTAGSSLLSAAPSSAALSRPPSTRQPLLGDDQLHVVPSAGDEAAPAAPSEMLRPQKRRRTRLHKWWRRVDRTYLQHWFGGAASAGARRRRGEPESVADVFVRHASRFGSQLQHAGGSAEGGSPEGMRGGSGPGGSGGEAFWGGERASAAAGEPEWLRSYEGESDDDETSDTEAERVATEAMTLLVRRTSHDPFVLPPRRLARAGSRLGSRPGSQSRAPSARA